MLNFGLRAAVEQGAILWRVLLADLVEILDGGRRQIVPVLDNDDAEPHLLAMRGHPEDSEMVVHGDGELRDELRGHGTGEPDDGRACQVQLHGGREDVSVVNFGENAVNLVKEDAVQPLRPVESGKVSVVFKGGMSVVQRKMTIAESRTSKDVPGLVPPQGQ